MGKNFDMNDLSVIYSWYNPDEYQIKRHFDCYSRYTNEERKRLFFIYVDDCSEKFPDIKPTFPINLLIARITTDVGYNNGGAKNLGFYLAKTQWAFQADRDHIIVPKIMSRLLKFQPEHNHFYFFKRLSELKDGKIVPNTYHCNTYLIETKKFFEHGGFDEDFSGYYGHEDWLFKIIIERKMIRDSIDLELLEIQSFKTSGINRDMTRNSELLLKKKNDKNYKNGKILRFNWKIVKEFKFIDGIKR